MTSNSERVIKAVGSSTKLAGCLVADRLLKFEDVTPFNDSSSTGSAAGGVGARACLAWKTASNWRVCWRVVRVGRRCVRTSFCWGWACWACWGKWLLDDLRLHLLPPSATRLLILFGSLIIIKTIEQNLELNLKQLSSKLIYLHR